MKLIDPLGLKDYLDKCKGRYRTCAQEQTKDGPTLKNWINWNVCKKLVDKACSKGFPYCCKVEYDECLGDAEGDELKVLECTKKHLECVKKGR